MPHNKHNLTKRSGFTLIEIMLVLFILMTIIGIGTFSVITVQRNAMIRIAKVNVENFSKNLDLYASIVGCYPSSEDGLDALRNCPTSLPDPSKWVQVAKKDIPLDPWGSPYQYQYPGSHNADTFDLWSFGPDKITGTEDDITNWTN
ncbi:MAG: type II secretion system major pseudopilin GspG [Planctomycetaceae bacterium]|nr:type II secretion system major pseudopilin GspG [Planctomycetaceae bacterium]